MFVPAMTSLSVTSKWPMAWMKAYLNTSTHYKAFKYMKAVAIKAVPNVTDRAFGIEGETYPIKDRLKELGGVWSGSHKMWVFSKKRYESVTRQLGIQDVETRPETKKAVPTKKELLKGMATSPRHLAMMHLLAGSGLRPDDIARFTGLFGKDRHGKAFGESERRSMIWMLNGDQQPVDVLSIELCQDYFFMPESVQDALMECVNEFSGPGGQRRMMEAMAAMENDDFLPF
jgi:hypothetical protein